MEKQIDEIAKNVKVLVDRQNAQETKHLLLEQSVLTEVKKQSATTARWWSVAGVAIGWAVTEALKRLFH